LKIRSSASARRPSEEESQRPAGQQANCEDHGKEGHYSPAQSLEKPRRHEVVGGDQQQLMGQHANSMADHSDQRRPDCRPRDALARAQRQRHERSFVSAVLLP
jgi:hypothetical protein